MSRFQKTHQKYVMHGNICINATCTNYIFFMSSVMLRVAELLYAPKNYARRKSSCFNMSWAGGVCEIIRVHLGVILYIFIPKPAASCFCVTTWIWWGSLPWLATAWCIQLLIASHLWLLFIPKYSITQVSSIKHLFKIIKSTRDI